MSGYVDLSTTTVPGSGYLYSRVYGEDHTGGAGTGVIMLAGPYKLNSVAIFFNMGRLRRGASYDYVETSPALATITLQGLYAVPSPTDEILVDYDPL